MTRLPLSFLAGGSLMLGLGLGKAMKEGHTVGAVFMALFIVAWFVWIAYTETR